MSPCVSRRGKKKIIFQFRAETATGQSENVWCQNPCRLDGKKSWDGLGSKSDREVDQQAKEMQDASDVKDPSVRGAVRESIERNPSLITVRF